MTRGFQIAEAYAVHCAAYRTAARLMWREQLEVLKLIIPAACCAKERRMYATGGRRRRQLASSFNSLESGILGHDLGERRPVDFTHAARHAGN